MTLRCEWCCRPVHRDDAETLDPTLCTPECWEDWQYALAEGVVEG